MMSVETISRRGFLAAGAVGAAMVGVGGFGAVSRQADAASCARRARSRTRSWWRRATAAGAACRRVPAS
ncbi:MAG: twin-arginine translocation signal domain-containing protein [Eggerthella lenta]